MSFDDEKQEVIASIKKNNRGDYINVSKITNGSNEVIGVDIRQFFTNDDDELCPTKKGLRIKIDNLNEVLDALAKIVEGVNSAS